MSPTSTSCPRCLVPLVARHGALHEDVCPKCDGRFLATATASRVFETFVGVDAGMLEALAAHFGGKRIPCPGCEQPMRPMQLSSVPVDVCLMCGGLWCDAGELSRLSRARVEEVSAVDDATKLNNALAIPAATAVTTPAAPSDALASRREAAFTYTVYRTTDALVDEAVLHRAYAESGALTAVDAAQRGGRQRGILATRLRRAPAQALADAFVRLGVPCAVVDRAIYRPPAPSSVRAFRLEDGVLTYLDQYNRRTPLNISDIALVGTSRTIQETATRGGGVKDTHRLERRGFGLWGGYATAFEGSSGVQQGSNSRSASVQTLRIDVFVHGDTRLSAHDAHIFGQARPAYADETDVAHFVAALLAHAPHLPLTAGARDLAARGEGALPAERLALYEEELEWRHWRATHAPSAP